MGAKYYGGGSSSGSNTGSSSGVTSSSIDKPAGTLSKTSAETGQVFSNVSERKTASTISQVERLGVASIGIGKIDKGVYSDVKQFLNARDAQRQAEQQGSVKAFGGEIKSVLPTNANIITNAQGVPVASRDPYIRDAQGVPIGLKAPQVARTPFIAPQQQQPTQLFTPTRQQEDKGFLKETYDFLERKGKQSAEFNRRLLKGDAGAVDYARFVINPMLAPMTTPKQQAKIMTQAALFGVSFGVGGLAGVGSTAAKGFVQGVGIGAARAGLQMPRAAQAINLFSRANTFVQASTPLRAISTGTGLLAENLAITLGTKQVAKGVVGKEGLRTAQEAQSLLAFNDVFARDEKGNVIGVNPDPQRSGIFGFGTIKQEGTKTPKPFYKQALLGITQLGVDPSGTGEFESNVRNLAKLEGLNDQQIEQRVKQARLSREITSTGELFAAINIERGVERFGRGIIAKQFIKSAEQVGKVTEKKLAGEIFRRTAIPFFAGGGLEGGISAVSQSVIRGEPISALNVGLQTTAGVVTGGLFGIPTASFAVTRPATSKTIGAVGTLLDAPFETLGDVSANAQEAAIRGFLKRPTFAPSVTKLQKEGVRDLFILGEQKLLPTLRPSKIRMPIVSLGMPILSFGSSQTITKSPRIPNVQGSLVNNPFLNNLRNINQQTNQNTPSINDNTQTPTNNNTATNSLTQTTQNIRNQQNTISTAFNFAVPVVTPVSPFIGMPPIPPMFPTESGGRGGGGSNKKIFINELAASQQLFKEQLGFNLQDLFNPIKKPSKTNSRKSKR